MTGDPSGAEMRSPNDECRAIGPDDFGCELPLGHEGDHRAFLDDIHQPRPHRQISWPVSPRSSGGAPLSVEQIADHVAYAASVVAPQPRNGSVARIYALCDSHEALRTQVSALRQEAAELARICPDDVSAEVYIGALESRLTKSEAKTAAARQEAARLLENEAAFVREAMALRDEVIAARQEAETLRGQLDAERARLDWMVAMRARFVSPRRIVWWYEDRTERDEAHGPSPRDAIDEAAARVAAPREPK